MRKKQLGIRALTLMVLLLAPAALSAQAANAAHPAHRHAARRHARARKIPRHVAPAPPAQVSLVNGQMTVVLRNADLSQALSRIAGVSGMQVSGAAPPAPLSGTYGPGSPRDVLTELLDQDRCSYVMAGDTPAGLPHRLLLMAATRSESASPPPAQQPAQPEPAVEADQTPASTEEAPAPGAILNVPPNEAAGSDGPENAPARRQQNLRRLQQMQEQQENHQPERP